LTTINNGRAVLTGYGGAMVALGVTYYAEPSWHIAVWSAIGLLSAGAIVLGVLRNQPRHRLPWLLIAAGVLTFNAGDTTYNVLTGVFHQDNPYPSVADLLYLITFPLLAGGLLGLARSGSAGRDRASLLDALTLTFGLGLLSWIFLITPYLNAGGLTLPQRLTSIGYPLGDVVILATVARLLAAARRTPAVVFLTLGSAGLLVADVLYGLIQLNGDWRVGGPVDLGWLLFYGAWGAAALHPSMVVLSRPRIVRTSELSARRLGLLTLSSLIAPAVLLVEAAHGPVPDAGVIAVLSAVLFLLVLTRLAGVAETHRQAVARERALREAGAALVSATDVSGVIGTVRGAVARLLPPGTEHRVALQVYHSTDELARAPRRCDVVRRDDLDPATSAGLGDFETALRCPLTIPDRHAGDPRVGVLFVAAEDRALIGLAPAVEVVATQAALALERIALTAEISRRDSEAYFRTLVHHATDVILIVDDAGRIRYASPSAGAMFGAEVPPGTALDNLIDEPTGDPLGRALQLMRLGDARAEGVDWRVKRGDGQQLQVEVSHRDLRDDPTVRGLVVTLRDVTQQRRLEDELTHRAFHDSLTGLANRVLFTDRLRQAASRVRRSGAVAGMLFIDLDDFKVVNDTLGHHVGDELLVAVGHRLVDCLRPHDTAARLGGDEFAALIEDAADIAEIEQVAARISAALSEPFQLGNDVVSGAASIGVATTMEAETEEDLRRQADLALYVAKGAGKGQWRRYQPDLHTAILERLELRAALDQAVVEDQFVLRYQPIVELATGNAVGFEALVRWRHPDRGLIAPGDFIGAAEETGAILPIGNWVLEHAMAEAVRWRPPGSRYLSVNVSVRQFRSPDFVERVLGCLRETGLPPEALMLEMTESLLLRDDEEVWAHLAALRRAGVRVAIDDFGTGYSSLSYLRQVSIDVLKIDKSFVETIGSSPQQWALVDGIIRLAHTLGLEVVAEGIETVGQRDLLLDMGCRLGQGYLFARPLTFREASEWVRTDEVTGLAIPADQADPIDQTVPTDQVGPVDQSGTGGEQVTAAPSVVPGEDYG
jgi:diguanylate cyclase (GGDEF)-like protein/PAS domain S-box-containing protein